jgi:urease accessory protein
MPASSTLLTLADGRLPAGGHAHSGGLEEAVGNGRVSDATELAQFLAGRLHTSGSVDACLAALSCCAAPSLAALVGVQSEATARAPAPALRAASKAQGRGLLRAAQAMWPAAAAGWLGTLADHLPGGPMYPVALGAVAAAIGLEPGEAALVAAHCSVSGPAWADTRLLGLDPFAVGRCLAQMAPAIEQVAAAATAAGVGGAALGPGNVHLPAFSAPLLDIGAEAHERWEVRLFAS